MSYPIIVLQTYPTLLSARGTGGQKRARGVRALRTHARGVPGHEPKELPISVRAKSLWLQRLLYVSNWHILCWLAGR